MKVSELAFERIVKCELCGCEFVIRNKMSRVKRCPECAIVIQKGNKQEGFRRQNLSAPRKKRVSKLDTLVREARDLR